MRRSTLTAVTALTAGGLLLTGCTAGDEAPDADTVPSTVVPEDLGEDQVREDELDERFEDLDQQLEEAEEGIREEARAALDEAEEVADEAFDVREGTAQDERDAVADRLDASVQRLETTADESPDAYGRALTELTGQLRRLAEELRETQG